MKQVQKAFKNPGSLMEADEHPPKAPKAEKAPKFPSQEDMAKANQKAMEDLQKQSKAAMKQVQKAFKNPGSLMEVDEHPPKASKAEKAPKFPSQEDMAKANQKATED